MEALLDRPCWVLAVAQSAWEVVCVEENGGEGGGVLC